MRLSAVTVLMTSAPRRSTSKTCASSWAKVPEAGMTGLASRSAPISTDRSTIPEPPPAKDRAFAADPAMHGRIPLAEGAYAAETHAEPACHLLLHGDFPEQAEAGGLVLGELEQAVGAAGIERAHTALSTQIIKQGGDMVGTGIALRIRNGDGIGAGSAGLLHRHQQIGVARAQDRGDIVAFATGWASGASVASPTPRATRTRWRAPLGMVNPFPSGPTTLSRSPSASLTARPFRYPSPCTGTTAARRHGRIRRSTLADAGTVGSVRPRGTGCGRTAPAGNRAPCAAHPGSGACNRWRHHGGPPRWQPPRGSPGPQGFPAGLVKAGSRAGPFIIGR